ncbi:xanthine dehydrogenase FAD-binding subunit XdhB [Sulfodiicoccus acidiphilus]|uniref:Xanthine dehydrogenase FAD-binding subunit XdhB n=1 Tax=Sulfodiicoccus acidiphilus TaxID=1670455 RepID=A0A348B6D1_9CREN|nr:FAD binding domain-containing protein [Sulfodiicoccus acidiphilus]BBD73733.1 xanthine dehydrogenase FAD-binding subunit XdhB [Sulfodiicoccus acidiphilus]GGT97949.1 xanthine dehydrogenase FAD-binding subunit XdhB [Sulfodiicoccus acidiphilus]
MLPRFKLLIPKTLEEAVQELSGGEATVVAGGTRVLLMTYMHVMRPEVLLSIRRLGLDFIQFKGDRIEVGANVTLSQLVGHDEVRGKFPLLHASASQVADPSIRNKATVVGNVVNAVPYSSLVPAFLLMEGEATIRGPKGQRVVRAVDFFKGPLETAQGQDELVTSLSFKKLEGRGSFTEFRNDSELPVMNVAVWKFPNGRVSVAFTGLTPVPTLMELGTLGDDFRTCFREVRTQLQDKFSDQAMDDLRAGAEYRLHLASVLTARMLTEVS